jgi:hypothetical protein
MDVETEEGLARRYSMHFRVKAGKKGEYGRKSMLCRACEKEMSFVGTLIGQCEGSAAVHRVCHYSDVTLHP